MHNSSDCATSLDDNESHSEDGSRSESDILDIDEFGDDNKSIHTNGDDKSTKSNNDEIDNELLSQDTDVNSHNEQKKDIIGYESHVSTG